MSILRQNFHQDCEALINKLINTCLSMDYTYAAMAYYFDRDDIHLPNFTKFFKHCAEEKREIAEKLLQLQNMRGGRIVFQDIAKPETTEFGSCLESMNYALQIEKQCNHAALEFHKVATDSSDPQLTDYIETHILQESVEILKVLADHIGQLTRVGTGLGEYQFDRNTLSNSDD